MDQKFDVNYSAVTDQSLAALDAPILDCLEDRLPVYFEAVKKERSPAMDPNEYVLEMQALRKAENEKIAEAIMKICEKELSAILPKVAFWVKGKLCPTASMVWVINPFSATLMGGMNIGVALLEKDELRMGLLWDLKNQLMYSAVAGEGASNGNHPISVASRRLSAESRAMNYVIGTERKLSSHHASLITALRKKFGYALFINTLEENICETICAVACGEDDFSYGYGLFQYPAIAAAICIAEQAGAVITDFSGGREKLFAGEEFFCSNKSIHLQFLELVKEINN